MNGMGGAHRPKICKNFGVADDMKEEKAPPV